MLVFALPERPEELRLPVGVALPNVRKFHLRIVCLAWGSLIWKPGVLPVEGDWQCDGPLLPIEFARVGDKGELATVLCAGAMLSRVRWARLSEPDLATACLLLRRREEIPTDRPDGVAAVIVGDAPRSTLGASAVLQWATEKKLVEAVIWTSLPPRLDGVEGRVPGPEEAVAYLRQLDGPERRHAEDYVRRVPAEIKTKNRAALELAIAA